MKRFLAYLTAILVTVAPIPGAGDVHDPQPEPPGRYC
jgi:hypothetical protein